MIAVFDGCDAVYLGGKLFGARQYAANFSNEELKSAVVFAHHYGVKVYVTINTLAYDDDIPVIAEYLRFLSDIGADAILVQDVGILSLAREIVPDLPLHASTQMTIHNAVGVRFAAEHGVSRVVLSRELPFDDGKNRFAEAAKAIRRGAGDLYSRGNLLCILGTVPLHIDDLRTKHESVAA